ncbi:hypothetical protein Hamer_G018212 [Homarus americanus]|uniref:Uncharacterized protein n=1 Tax=Homarus americanus TaxID=6706 RepID=A0A8J5J817_HOMAM|nr:hypothetical protein Hamer_G018212 [Homarus americanus]
MRRNLVAERAEVRQSSRGGKREARFVGRSITGASAADTRGVGVGPAEARRRRGHERASATTGKGSAKRAGKSEDIVGITYRMDTRFAFSKTTKAHPFAGAFEEVWKDEVAEEFGGLLVGGVAVHKTWLVLEREINAGLSFGGSFGAVLLSIRRGWCWIMEREINAELNFGGSFGFEEVSKDEVAEEFRGWRDVWRRKMRRNRVAERAEVRQSSRGGKREARFVGGSITYGKEPT